MKPGMYEAEVVEVQMDNQSGIGMKSGFVTVEFDGAKYRMANGKPHSVPPRFRKIGSKFMVHVTENYGLRYAGG